MAKIEEILEAYPALDSLVPLKSNDGKKSFVLMMGAHFGTGEKRKQVIGLAYVCYTTQREKFKVVIEVDPADDSPVFESVDMFSQLLTSMQGKGYFMIDVVPIDDLKVKLLYNRMVGQYKKDVQAEDDGAVDAESVFEWGEEKRKGVFERYAR